MASSSVSRIPQGGNKLPQTDKERLLFYAELIVANIPSLISDLGSATYSILSLSEKTRNEVRNKTSLIQSLSASLQQLRASYATLQERQDELKAVETELVSHSAPCFLRQHEVANRGTSMASSASAASMRSPPREDSRGKDEAPVIILSDEDARLVQAAEEDVRALTNEVASLSREVDNLEGRLDVTKDQNEAARLRVRDLANVYEGLFHDLQRSKRETSYKRIHCDEEEARERLQVEAARDRLVMEAECWEAELNIIDGFIQGDEEQRMKAAHELKVLHDSNEVEIAAFQITCKEQQAEVERLKNDIQFLRCRQNNLELLAKKQESIKNHQNSLRNVLTAKRWTSGTSSGVELTPEQLAEVSRDHRYVSELAARVGLYVHQHTALQHIIGQVRDEQDITVIRGALNRIQDILASDMRLDRNALSSSA